MANPLRNLPSVHELLDTPPLKTLVERISQSAVVSTVRTVLNEVRHEVQTAAADRTLPSVSDLAERIARRVSEGSSPVLQPVVNATGILLHAALGRAPLADDAIAEMAAVARGYTNLEMDLASGQKSRRQEAVEGLLHELTGAEAALVVNNNAGATLLTLAALAAGREVIVSRGQLIETDDGYRLPEIVAASGAVLREVGATNSTRPDDYAQAIGPATAALMLVHTSRFVAAGLSGGIRLEELVDVGRRHKLPVIHDLGTGAMLDLTPFGIPGEPVVCQSIQSGAGVVLISGDKLLGGPSCGIILGRKALIEKIASHPIARTLRVGNLTLAALAATLRLYRDPEKARVRIPLLQLLTASMDNLKQRAERLAPKAAATAVVGEAEAVTDVSRLGSGVGPVQELPTWCIAIKPATMTGDRLAVALRTCTPPVIGRLKEDRLLLDLRSVLPRQDMQMIAALEALSPPTGDAAKEPPAATGQE
jgi:L-seryl-tRNA(Ser) seleniumtransferase